MRVQQPMLATFLTAISAIMLGAALLDEQHTHHHLIGMIVIRIGLPSSKEASFQDHGIVVESTRCLGITPNSQVSDRLLIPRDYLQTFAPLIERSDD